MLRVLRSWFDRFFSDPQAVLLAVLLVGLLLVVNFLGQILLPAIVAVVIAYLLEGLVGLLTRRGVPRRLAAGFVFVLFFASLIAIFFGLLPPVVRQATDLVEATPGMLDRAREVLADLPRRYPSYVSQAQIDEAIGDATQWLSELGGRLLGGALGTLKDVLTFLVYLILVPLLVFFFLMDRKRIGDWLAGFLPERHELLSRIWKDVDRQFGNYMRGKCWEILIVGVAAFLLFWAFELQYAILLAVLVGLSVIVPYVGAVLVTLPVAGVAAWQFGLEARCAWLLLGYLILQVLDGNVLVPVLFSEVVRIHPVAIIVAILFFGGIWGVWGVFFAIPLATLIDALVRAWPRSTREPGAE